MTTTPSTAVAGALPYCRQMGERGLRLRALDGLRGIAILMVIVDHVGFTGGRPLGAAGVTVFFALSGFLITRVIIDARERGEWSMRTFLLARLVRLMPALLAMELVVSVWWLLSGRPFSELGWQVLAASSYATNFVFQFEPVLLTHTWSLAVEEQFYLLWPLALPLVMRARSPFLLVGAAAVASMLVRLVLTVMGHETWAYASLASNAFCLLLGALLVVDQVKVRPGRVQRAVPLLGLIIITAVGTASPSGFAAGSIGVALLSMVVIAFALPGSPLLELGWLRFVGRISYSLYLWHWPVLVLLDQNGGGVSALPAVALSFALAAASTLWLEEPLRRRWRARRTAPVEPFGPDMPKVARPTL